MIRNFEVRLFEPRAVRKRGSCRIGINFKGSTVYTSDKFQVGLWDWKSEGNWGGKNIGKIFVKEPRGACWLGHVPGCLSQWEGWHEF